MREIAAGNLQIEFVNALTRRVSSRLYLAETLDVCQQAFRKRAAVFELRADEDVARKA